MANFSMNMSLSVGNTLTFSTPPNTPIDTNAQRIIAAYREILGMDPASTAQQVWARIGQGVFDGLKNNTISHERETQQNAIVVTDIT